MPRFDSHAGKTTSSQRGLDTQLESCSASTCASLSRLANPGLPGFSSNSAPQATQVLSLRFGGNDRRLRSARRKCRARRGAQQLHAEMLRVCWE